MLGMLLPYIGILWKIILFAIMGVILFIAWLYLGTAIILGFLLVILGIFLLARFSAWRIAIASIAGGIVLILLGYAGLI